MSFGAGRGIGHGPCNLLTNWLDFGFDLREASMPTFLPGDGAVAGTASTAPCSKELQRRGHVVGRTELSLGGARAIYIDTKNGVLSAGSDRARTATPLG
jgi:gamma-glutamyltranspeptidase